MLPRILITPGEPSGIGPDICIQLSQEPASSNLDAYDITVIADPELLESRAHQLGLPIHIIDSQNNGDPTAKTPGSIQVLPVTLGQPAVCGQADPGNANYTLKTLQIAVQSCLSGRFDAMVTGPVNKGVINDAGIPFSGHTEYLAGLCETKQVVMMLSVPDLKVALATTHLPISQVSQAITSELLEKTLCILHQDLTRLFAITNPRILVCGLNPHAGENGHMGREEIDTIIPVIKKLRGEGLNISGPTPADTAFTKDSMQRADVILAMYHDQGLAVLKHMGFGKAVNTTLGLPIIRTSVDHGTALEIAGTGKANISSMVAAIHSAASMIEHSKK